MFIYICVCVCVYVCMCVCVCLCLCLCIFCNIIKNNLEEPFYKDLLKKSLLL